MFDQDQEWMQFCQAVGIDPAYERRMADLVAKAAGRRRWGHALPIRPAYSPVRREPEPATEDAVEVWF